MAINIDKAYEVGPDGLAVSDNDGNILYYIASGVGDPTGSSAPQNTWYFREDNQLIYYKFGAGDNDWRQIRAEDFTFDPSTTDLSSTEVQAAIEELANRHFGKDHAFITRTTSADVTGNTFIAYTTLNFNVSDASGINRYRISANYLWGHNSASNDIRVQLVLDGGSPIEMRAEPKDQGTDQRYSASYIEYFDNLSQGSHSLVIQYRPATASRVSRMHRATLEVWRVS